MSIALTTEQLETFTDDGVVLVNEAVDKQFLAPIAALAELQLNEPGQWVTDTNPGSSRDRLFTSRYLWRDQTSVYDFLFDSGIARLAGQALRSSSVRFYFDHLLVKEPGTAAPTPWHQDIPYWPFLGKQICSVWVSLTSSTVEESSLEFVRGSHRWGAYYTPESFDGEANWTVDFEGERCPDIEAARADYDIVGFDVEPGDAIIFSSWIVHGAPGNAGDNRRVALSTRWLGDDTTWHPHPGCDPMVGQQHTTSTPGEYPSDDDRFPVIWSR